MTTFWGVQARESLLRLVESDAVWSGGQLSGLRASKGGRLGHVAASGSLNSQPKNEGGKVRRKVRSSSPLRTSTGDAWRRRNPKNEFPCHDSVVGNAVAGTALPASSLASEGTRKLDSLRVEEEIFYRRNSEREELVNALEDLYNLDSLGVEEGEEVEKVGEREEGEKVGEGEGQSDDAHISTVDGIKEEKMGMRKRRVTRKVAGKSVGSQESLSTENPSCKSDISSKVREIESGSIIGGKEADGRREIVELGTQIGDIKEDISVEPQVVETEVVPKRRRGRPRKVVKEEYGEIVGEGASLEPSTATVHKNDTNFEIVNSSKMGAKSGITSSSSLGEEIDFYAWQRGEVKETDPHSTFDNVESSTTPLVTLRKPTLLDVLKGRSAERSRRGRRRRLSLSSRILLNQQKMLGLEGEGESEEREWEGVELPGTAGGMKPKELQKLIADYEEMKIPTSNWPDSSRKTLKPTVAAQLGHLVQAGKKFEKVRAALRKDLGREPTPSEWARACHVSLPILKKQMGLRDAAKNKLLQHNIGLVLKTAHRLTWRDSSLSLEDVCQSGFKGLAHGIEKWEPERGFKLSTYVTHWIFRSILRSNYVGGFLLRIPGHVGELYAAVIRNQLALKEELGRAPTLEEVAERSKMKVARCRAIIAAFKPAESSNVVHPTLQVEMSDFITCKNENQNLEHLQNMRLAIDEVLASLTPNESLVLRQRFGLDGGGPRTLAAVSAVVHVSREMCRKYEARGLLKLKQAARTDFLRAYAHTEE